MSASTYSGRTTKAWPERQRGKQPECTNHSNQPPQQLMSDKPKPEARNSTQASKMVGRNPSTGAITTGSQDLHEHEVGVSSQSFKSGFSD